MIIRKAMEGDAHGIAQVHVKSWQEAYKGIINQEYLDQLKVEDRLALWEQVLSSSIEESPVYVAVNAKDQIVGFASFGMERLNKQKSEAELYAIYILNEYKRQKIGTQLLSFGLKALINQNYKSLVVWVLAKNPSRRFYEYFNPIQICSENVQIGNFFYEEIEYKWTNLELLIEELN